MQATGAPSKLAAPADDLSCALFALAHVVTIMFWALQTTTGACVEGAHIQRPWWLEPSVHILNSVAAWGDLLTAPGGRRFSSRAQRLSVALVIGYMAYITAARRFNG